MTKQGAMFTPSFLHLNDIWLQDALFLNLLFVSSPSNSVQHKFGLPLYSGYNVSVHIKDLQNLYL